MRVKPSYAVAGALILVIFACREPERLTPGIAREVIDSTMLQTEPVYAEVPVTVRWSPEAPMDEFDRRSIETLERLERLGLVSVEAAGDETRGTVTATTAPEAARILGVVPSVRGPALRGRVAEKRRTGIGELTLHPSDPRTGRVEVIWHYESPTQLHAAFAPVSDRPIGVPQATVLTLSWIEGAWRGKVVVRRTRPTTRAGSTSSPPRASQ